MTKQQEIEALTNFIKSLPLDTYLRPWLEEVIHEVIADIRSDFVVSPTISGAKERCDQLLQQARKEAAGIIEAAQRERDQIHKNGQRQILTLLESIHSAERILCS